MPSLVLLMPVGPWLTLSKWILAEKAERKRITRALINLSSLRTDDVGGTTRQ